MMKEDPHFLFQLSNYLPIVFSDFLLVQIIKLHLLERSKELMYHQHAVMPQIYISRDQFLFLLSIKTSSFSNNYLQLLKLKL
jgi:hypothetical protein